MKRHPTALEVRSLILAGLVVLLPARPVAAQDRHESGFWFVTGFGPGSANITCTACTSGGSFGGVNWTLQMGGTPSEYVRIGGVSDWWWHPVSGDWDRWFKSLTASVRYYPWTVDRGLFVEAGPTYSQALVRLTDTTGLARHGWGVTAGVGGDVLPRWRVMFVPRLAFTYAWVGDIYYPLGSRTLFARAWRHWVLHFGLDLGFRDRYRNEG